MAGEDPNNPTQTTDQPNTAQTVANTQAVTVAVNESNEAITKYNSLISAASSAFDYYQQRAQQVGVSLKDNHKLTVDQTAAFGKLSVELLGARQAWTSLGGSIDETSVHGFMDQWKNLSETIQNAPITSQFSMIKNVLESLGAPISEVQNALKGGFNVAMSYAEAFMTSADNGARLQNALVQLAAKTGNLSEVTRLAGPNLMNLNTVLASQQKIVDDAASAMKEDHKVVEQYYTMLGSIPQTLNQTVQGTDAVGGSVSMLTAAMQFAKGSGRSFTDVVTDLKTAFHDYNLTGEPALKFTAQISELSNKFGVELEDVQSALRSTASDFKMFGNEAEGAAKMVNSYLGELQKTGISGKTALDVIGGLTQGIKGMTLAQKGFLSAQTGGPGGLMGAFQIEKMMRDGKMDEVFDKVRQSMSKQFGNIVTLNDAQNSPQAAAQLTKQMMVLQQGPLGRFAKDDQSAMRILEAFKSRDAGGPASELSKSIVQDTMKTGVDLQEKTNTLLSEMLGLMQRSQSQASLANYTSAQNMFSAQTGSSNPGDPNAQMRRNLQRSDVQGARRSGQTIEQQNDMIAAGALKDQSGRVAATLVDDYKKFFDNVGPMLKGPISKINEMFKKGDQSGANQEAQTYMNSLEAKKRELASAPDSARKSAAMQKLNEEQQQMKSYYEEMVRTNGQYANRPASLGMQAPNTNANLRGAANRAVSIQANAAQSEAPAANAPQASGNNGPITVQVEGFCLNCGTKMRNNSHRNAVAPGSRAGEDH